MGKYVAVRVVLSRHDWVLVGKPLDFDVFRPKEDVLHGFADVKTPLSIPYCHVLIPKIQNNQHR